MKKGNNTLVIVDYTTIIVAFITFLLSLVVYNTFNYRSEADFYLGMMVVNFIIILIGFKNLRADTK